MNVIEELKKEVVEQEAKGDGDCAVFFLRQAIAEIKRLQAIVDKYRATEAKILKDLELTNGQVAAELAKAAFQTTKAFHEGGPEWIEAANIVDAYFNNPPVGTADEIEQLKSTLRTKCRCRFDNGELVEECHYHEEARKDTDGPEEKAAAAQRGT